MDNNFAVNFAHFFDVFIKAKNKSFYNNAFFLILNSITASIIGFVFWNIMARTYLPTNVGIGSAIVSASTLLGALANLGLGIGLVRYVPEAADKGWGLVNSAFIVTSCASLAASIIYGEGIFIWSPDLRMLTDNYFLYGIFIFFTLAIAMSAIIDQSFIAARNAKYVFYKNFVISIAKVYFSTCIFNYLGGFGIFAGVGTATFLGVLISLVCFLPGVFKGHSPKPAYFSDLYKKIFLFSFGNYLANILNSLPGLIYPLMALKVLGPEKSAFFYIAWMMVMVLAIIPGGLANSLLAEGSYDQNKIGQNVKYALKLSIMLSIPSILLLIILCGWFLSFFGKDYAEHGAGLIRILSLSIIPQCINIFYITINQFKKRIDLILIQTVIISAVSIGVGYILLGYYGLCGVGMAYTLAHFLVAIIVSFPLWRSIREFKVVQEKNFSTGSN